MWLIRIITTFIIMGTMEEAHRKATLIEMQIKTELKIDATIHIEPLKM